MLKLVAVLALAGALAAGVFLVPLRGRTVADRWRAAPGPGRFASESYDEARRALAGDARPAVPPPAPLREGRQGRGQEGAAASRGSAARPDRKAMPAEHHTAEDRASLDRLLSERSR